jgi:outer membrane protein assembly factor BamB
MKRRALLGTAAFAATAGCLRFTSSGGGGTSTAAGTDATATERSGGDDDVETPPPSTDSSGGTGDTTSSGPGGRLFAFDRDGGDSRWTFEAPNDGQHGNVSQLATDGTRVFAGTDDQGSGDDQEPLVFALDADSGEQRYVVDDLPASFVNEVFVRDGTLYVYLVNGELHTFAAEGGERQATYSVPLGFAPPVVIGTEMYAPGSEVVALDRTSGTRQWSTPLPAGANARPVVTDDAIYVGTQAGHVVALRRSSGETLWQARTTAEVNSLAFGSTALWVSDESSTVYAYAPGDGTELFREESEDASNRPLATVDDLLFVGGRPPSVRRVEGRSGDSVSTTELWSSDDSVDRFWSRDGVVFGADWKTVQQYGDSGPTGPTFGPISDLHIAIELAADDDSIFVGSRRREQ